MGHRHVRLRAPRPIASRLKTMSTKRYDRLDGPPVRAIPDYPFQCKQMATARWVEVADRRRAPPHRLQSRRRIGGCRHGRVPVQCLSQLQRRRGVHEAALAHPRGARGAPSGGVDRAQVVLRPAWAPAPEHDAVPRKHRVIIRDRDDIAAEHRVEPRSVDQRGQQLQLIPRLTTSSGARGTITPWRGERDNAHRCSPHTRRAPKRGALDVNQRVHQRDPTAAVLLLDGSDHRDPPLPTRGRPADALGKSARPHHSQLIRPRSSRMVGPGRVTGGRGSEEINGGRLETGQRSG